MTLQDVRLGKALGKGAFGVVFVGHLRREVSALSLSSLIVSNL